MMEAGKQNSENRIQKKQFKKSVLISLAGHLTVFSMFSLSFGAGGLKFNNTRVSFLGSVLNQSDLEHPARNIRQENNLLNSLEPAHLYRKRIEFKITNSVFKKPLSEALLNIERGAEEKYSRSNIFPVPPAVIKNKPVIMLYPRLPYQFIFYFKDRQEVHIEVIFNSSSIGKTTSSLVKRKISSGNLEADLLSMRYISHYLFIQNPKMRADEWQAVKIDLSAKNK